MVRIDFNRLRFLVVDDNVHMRRILRTLLHGFGAREVYEAEDGAAGLEAFTQYIPDIVIADWVMPVFDGLELTQMIRQPGANANPYVAIIMLTGHSEKKRVTAARDAGITEFLAKPISAKSLYERIVNVIANPRPFIRTETYFGPDRRRNVNPNYVGPERRKGVKADVIRQAPLLDVTYGDHEVILPENSLRKAISKKPLDAGEEHPVARAERALAELSSEFAAWMDAECERLDQARRDVNGAGFNKGSKEILFRAAHDIKGEAATFGYPALASVSSSLCRLIEHTPDLERIPITLVDQHVDAVRAIYREYARSDAEDLAASLTKRLREVTNDFLIRENHDRPDVIEMITEPSFAPE
jgi:two-component system, chemotaxis family, chemotaxis protein CheY